MVSETLPIQLRQRAGRLKRAVRRRLPGGDRRRTAPPGYGVPVTRPRRQCLVCGGERVRSRRLTFVKDEKLTCRIRRCRDCGFVQILRRDDKYRSMTSIDELPKGNRAGRAERPGREFHMAKMALDMIGGSDRDVLIFGVGRSQDNRHLEQLPETGHVAVGDIMRVRDDENFVDISKPAERRFDVVVASEVIEHFRRPRQNFARLFEFVKDDGLVVCGTDIYDGASALARHRYIFYPDHTSYYTPEALRVIARARGWLLDFRPTGGGRKRYVLLSRSPEVMQDVACYFGREPYAPSERERPAPLRAQRSHAKWRTDPSQAPGV